MRHINDMDFSNEVFEIKENGRFANEFRGDLPVVLDLYAVWCGPCKFVSPVLESLERRLTDRVRFYKVNVDDGNVAAMVRNFGVRSIPTLVFINTDGTIRISVGAMTEVQVTAKIDEYFSVVV